MFSAMQRTRMALRPTGARFMGMGGHSMEHAIGTSKPRPGTIWAAAAQGQEGTVVSPCMDEFLLGHMHRPDLGNGASLLACRPFAPLSPWPSPSAPTSPWLSCAPRHLPSLPAETDKWKKISYVFMPFCGIYAVFVGVKHMSHGHHDHEHVRRAPHPHTRQARPSRSPPLH